MRKRERKCYFQDNLDHVMTLFVLWSVGIFLNEIICAAEKWWYKSQYVDKASNEEEINFRAMKASLPIED